MGTTDTRPMLREASTGIIYRSCVYVKSYADMRREGLTRTGLWVGTNTKTKIRGAFEPRRRRCTLCGVRYHETCDRRLAIVTPKQYQREMAKVIVDKITAAIEKENK